MADATIIAAHLDDKELRASIDKLVSNVASATQLIRQDFDNTVQHIQRSFKTLGNVGLGGDGSSGNSSKRVAELKQEEQVTKDVAAAYDRMAKVQQVAVRTSSSEYRNADTLQTMNIQLDLLRERLREARNQYSSFVALAAHASTTGDKGLYQFATSNVHKYEDEVRSLIPQIRTLQDGIRQMGDVIAPQGHTIQNYVNSLQKANPELAQLNEMYRRGQSALQQQATSLEAASQAAVKNSVVTRDQNEELRKHADLVERLARDARSSMSASGTSAFLTPYRSGDGAAYIYAENDARSRGLTIEQQIENILRENARLYQEESNATSRNLENERAITQEQMKRKAYKAPDTWQGVDVTRDKIASIIASRAQLDKAAVINWDEQTSSLKTLSNALKQYQSAYEHMSAAERNSPFGRQMIADMAVLRDNIQKIKSDMSRLSKEQVFNMPTRTIEEITQKMRALSAYRSGLNVDTQRKEIAAVNYEYQRLQKQMDGLMQKNQSLIGSNNALTRSWNYMKNRLAFYFTVGASTAFVKNLIDIRGQYELLERSIGILIDSAQNGSQIFGELNSMAIKSPFTTMELGAAAKQLVAYDVAAKDVVDTTRRLADMAAAVGIPIERLTYALGQIKAYGYLNSRDARMFANAGIPLVKELADYYTQLEGRLVSTADIYDRIKKKSIEYNDVMQVMYKMTDEGGKFFNFQEKAADTLKVRIANLTLAWNTMLNEMGKDNQGVLAGALKISKDIFESWRNINNIIMSILYTYGSLKAAQMVYYFWVMRTEKSIGLWAKTLGAVETVFSVKIANAMKNMWSSFSSFVMNPTAILATLGTALSVIFTKAYLDFRELQKASEAFNKSIADNADENVKSIDKFFDEYKKQLSSIGSLSGTDQTKLWERLQEEIEKTTKNAQAYIDILNKEADVANRIKMGESFLEQAQIIEKEAKRLAEQGVFSVGGGFGNDAMSKDLINYGKNLQSVIDKFGSLAEAEKHAMEGNATSMYSASLSTWGLYAKSLQESETELDKFVSKLDKADLSKVMGEGDAETQLANIREFVNIIRDGYLATEQGQKIATSGRALLNSKLDEWISKMAVSQNLISNERGVVEENKTAWEVFFDQLNKKDKERLDYLIASNQTGSKDFQELWDKAANEMAKNATASYDLIQDQIENLRNTPDIVIKVVYRQEKENLDAQQQAFTDRYLTPSNWVARNLDADTYMAELKENTEQYGRYMKKTGEDNVEWEERLGKEYQDNAKKIQSLNGQLANSIKLSEADKKAKEGELQVLNSQQSVLKQIAADQNFNYEQFKKGGKNGGAKKDVLGDALAKEVQLVTDMQKRYKEYRQIGVSANDALTLSTGEYGKSLARVNGILAKFGFATKSNEELAKMDMRQVRDYFGTLLTLANTKGNAKGVEALEKAIAGLNVEISKIDYKKITDGLNNQLSKLKDDYELAVELNTNPEMSNLFLDLFDIDANELPQNIDQYAERVLNALNDSFKKRKTGFILPTLDLTQDDIAAYKKQVDDGLLDQATFDAIEKNYKNISDLRRRNAQDTLKQIQDLEYKLADTNGKIAIEEEKLQNLKQRLAKETNDEQRRLLELQIKDQENAIAKLKEDVLQMLPTYKNLFNSIVEHSTRVTRKLAKQWKDALNNAVKNADGTYTVTDPMSGEKATISARQYGKEIDKVDAKLRETLGTFAKIKEAFTKGEDGIVDWVKGLELVAEEARKAADGMHTIADIVSELGGEDADEAVEVMNDIATSVEGLATAAGGIAQISGGDIVGGTVNVIKGVWNAVSSWFDNKNKKINKAIKESERTVNRLQNAYEALDYAVGKAMGDAETSARRATVENKKLQLAELERQLMLEKSRKKKKQDQDRIIELEGEIASIKREIQDLTEDVVNTLLGSDVKSAAEEFVDAWVQAWRAGETTLDAMNEKMDEIMQNLIKKAITNKIVGTLLQPFYDEVDRMTSSGSEGNETLTTNELKLLAQQAGLTAEEINRALGEFYGNLNQLGILSQTVDANKNLSALQQGIQSITEDTAGALEAYMNGVSQQVYYQSQILTEIRDAVVTMDNDIQLSTQAQMLLQLQQSYQVQMSIQGILEGVLNPAGRAFNVELIS